MSKEIDPKMHTAEHILNGTMVKFLGCDRCFSAHIEKKKSKCDYYFDRGVAEEEIRKVERKVNEIIGQDLPVTEETISQKEAENKYNLQRLPEGTSNDIRIIKVGDYDACPCIGHHVDSTDEIGNFKIISYNWNDGVLRIRFKLL